MASHKADIKQKIKQYIMQAQGLGEKDLSDDTVNLFEEGIIDSLGAFDLAAFLESTFKLKFEEEHFFDQRFRSIEGIASLISEIKNGVRA